MVSCVLLDFFGTLVDYDHGGAASVRRSTAVVRGFGPDLSETEFSRVWDDAYAELEAACDEDDHEFSMDEVTRAFLLRVLDRDPAQSEVDALAAAYLDEWNTGVRYVDGIRDAVVELAGRYRLAVVSNTNDFHLVPAHIAAMDLTGHIETVVMSVEVGRRKPHPAIYAETLRRLDVTPAEAVFAGDTYRADFAGPQAFGIRAYLIDPAGAADVPAGRRLRSLVELPDRLRAAEAAR